LHSAIFIDLKSSATVVTGPTILSIELFCFERLYSHYIEVLWDGRCAMGRRRQPRLGQLSGLSVTLAPPQNFRGALWPRPSYTPGLAFAVKALIAWICRNRVSVGISL
jgi:hypothetical protein